MQNKIIILLRRFVCFGIVLFLAAACDPPNNPTYGDGAVDPFPVDRDPPVLTEMLPNRGFPGFESTITGVGFRPDANQTLVNIGTAVAEVLSVSENEIRIQVPRQPSGEQRVRVAVWGSDIWSNDLVFVYEDDFLEMDFGISDPGGITVDDDNNIYITSVSNQAVYRIDALDGSMTTYASAPVRGSIEFGPDGYLYIATQTGLSRIEPGGGNVEVVVIQAAIVDFDWNANGDIYLLTGATGNQIRIYTGGIDAVQVGSSAQGQQIRVFGNYLYVTELFNRRVARFEIIGNELGPREIDFLLSYFSSGLDIDHNGSLYVGTHSQGIVVKARQDRADNLDIEYLPEPDSGNEMAGNVGPVYIHNTVMYVVNTNVGRIYRIFIGESNAPRYGRE